MAIDINVLVVATAVGTTVTTTTGILLAFQKWFMPRAECEHKHEDVEKERDDDTKKRHEIRGVLNKVNLRTRRLDRRLDVYSERQRWIVAGIQSLMEKVGANGVPPPPDLQDPPHDDEEIDL